jgi:hypothetical protein
MVFEQGNELQIKESGEKEFYFELRERIEGSDHERNLPALRFGVDHPVKNLTRKMTRG